MLSCYNAIHNTTSDPKQVTACIIQYILETAILYYVYYNYWEPIRLGRKLSLPGHAMTLISLSGHCVDCSICQPTVAYADILDILLFYFFLFLV
ncbi:hypothetical protein V1521DRAFT_433614, partial [Lipomyces starkeyi]